MSKTAAIFVAAAMAVTAVCVAVIASFGLDLGLPESALAGFGALVLMAVTHLAFQRAAPKDDGRLEEIDRFVNELQSRLETLEARLSTLDGAAAERARAAVRPLVEEIAALGGLVTSIAKDVAAHDVALTRLKSMAPPPDPAIVKAAADRVVEALPKAEVRAPEPVAAPVPSSQKHVAPEPFDPAAFEPNPEKSGADDLASRIARAFAADRIEPHLQPIVTLPSRRVAHYEALARLVEDDGLLAAKQFLAAAGPTLPGIDRRMVERCADVALRVSARGGGSVFVNLAPETLRDDEARVAIADLMARRQELARLIVLELRHAAFRSLGPVERKAIEALVGQGLRLSIDGVLDLKIEPRELAAQGVRFVKTPASLLLDPEAARGLSIHPADLSGLLARHGADLIATHVEHERTVPELLDMEVRFAQGRLFGVPRPIRPPAPDAAVPEAPPPPARLVPRSVASR